MIPYVEVLNKYTLQTFALIEPTECWLELSYFEVGEFQVYCRASKQNLEALKVGNFIKIPNKRFIWVITSITYTFKADGARMISAKGYEAKYLLNKRIIMDPLALPNTLSSAVFKLIDSNLGAGADPARRLDYLEPLLVNIDTTLEDTQAPRGNLLEFTLNLCKTYGYGLQFIYEDGKLKYTILQGQDKSQSIKFSQAYDNLLASEYYTSDEGATAVLVVSVVEEVDYTHLEDKGDKGIDRNEILFNSNISTEYEVEGMEEKQKTEPTSDLYKTWLQEEGKKELANYSRVEEVNGELDLQHSIYTFDVDYFLGDKVGVRDEYFNFELSPRIIKVTFKQDAKKYGEEIEYSID